MSAPKFVDVGSPSLRELAPGTVFSLLIIAGTVLWVTVDPEFLARNAFEDGWIEVLSVVFFFLSGLLFLLAARKSGFLKTLHWSGYFFLVGLGLLMLLFAGEEASWGQWYFGFEPPEQIKAINTQDELNLHNLWFMQSTDWNTYRLISAFMLGIGVLLPLLALSGRVRSLMQQFAFPVMPIQYAAIFLGSYLFGKHYYFLLSGDTAAEIRELLLSVGMLVFAAHAWLRPDDLFRVTESREA